MIRQKQLLLVLLIGAGVWLTSCQSQPKPVKTAQPAANPAPGPKAGQYSSRYEEEFENIFKLARQGKWDEAEAWVNALAAKAPDDESVKRVQGWVAKQRQFLREKNIEDKIREIDAKNSDLNPSLPRLLTESKDRGLPPRQDVREAIQKMDAIPYFPENFGKTVRQKSRMFDLESPESRMAKILDKEISVHLDNVTLEAIIFTVGQQEGINFVADKALPAFKQTLSVNLDRVKLGEFLRYVARNLDVQFQIGQDLIWIVDAKDPHKLMEETRVFRLRHGFIMPASFGPEDVTRVTTTAANVSSVTETQKMLKFVNDNAPTNPVIETVIKQFFTGSKYLIDYERNVIVARGTPEQLEVLEKIVEEFDRPVQQVLIEARFITISETAFLKLGAAWETGRSTTPTIEGEDYTGLGKFSEINKDYSTGIGKTWTNLFPKILGRTELSATITALQQSGESQTLSAPRLTLVNNLPAMISDGKVQYYYEEYAVKQTLGQYVTASSLVPAGKPTKITSGVSLYVLASIGGDGRSILLALKPQVNQEVQMTTFAKVQDFDQYGRVSGTFEIKLPEYRTQELATRAVIKSGQTVVMGGVLEREQRKFVESVPVLGSIPIIGAAFRRRTEINRPRYLLIFVTATLLSENGELVLPEEDTTGKTAPASKTLSLPTPPATPPAAPATPTAPAKP